MKKLNTKQLKKIKAGRFSITGALFGGIASVIKASFDGVAKLVNTVGGWVMGFQERGKHYAKMSLKVGDTTMSYDDTTKIKAAEDLAQSQMKKGVINTANPKQVVLAKQPKVVELNDHHDTDDHHLDDPSQLLEQGMHMIDEFMHF